MIVFIVISLRARAQFIIKKTFLYFCAKFIIIVVGIIHPNDLSNEKKKESILHSCVR